MSEKDDWDFNIAEETEVKDKESQKEKDENVQVKRTDKGHKVVTTVDYEGSATRTKTTLRKYDENPKNRKIASKKGSGVRSGESEFTNVKTSIFDQEKIELDFKDVESKKSRKEYHEQHLSKKEKVEIAGEATIQNRILASSLDYALLLISYYFVKLNSTFFFSDISTEIDREMLLMLYWSLSIILFSSFHLIVLITLGKSLGRKIFKLRVVDEDSNQLGIAAQFFYDIIYLPVSILSVVGVLMILYHPKQKGLHHYISKSKILADF